MLFRSSAFFVVYFKIFGVLVAGFMIFVVVAALMGVLAAKGASRDMEQLKGAAVLIAGAVMTVYLLLFLFIAPWFAARIQNLVWNNTSLGPTATESHVRARDLLWLYVSNFFFIVATLGLFKPFADIRLAKYRLEHMALNIEGSLDDFLAHEQQSVSAVGEETADVFDVDISF